MMWSDHERQVSLQSHQRGNHQHVCEDPKQHGTQHRSLHGVALKNYDQGRGGILSIQDNIATVLCSGEVTANSIISHEGNYQFKIARIYTESNLAI